MVYYRVLTLCTVIDTRFARDMQNLPKPTYLAVAGLHARRAVWYLPMQLHHVGYQVVLRHSRLYGEMGLR